MKSPPTPEKTLGFVFAETTTSPAETIDGLAMVYQTTGRPVILCIANWDDDVRELPDIPEVIEWCRQVIRLGGLSYVAGVIDMPPGTDIAMHLPPQFLLAACAGWPGAERLGELDFRYNDARIQSMERQYRRVGFIRQPPQGNQ